MAGPHAGIRAFFVTVRAPYATDPVRTSTRTIVAAAWAYASVPLFLAAIGIDTVAAYAATHTIVIDGLKYEPEVLAVRRRDKVIWINKDPFPHTVTSKGVFDSREIAAGKSWTYTPRKAGEYAYICTLHPNMTGTVRVQ